MYENLSLLRRLYCQYPLITLVYSHDFSMPIRESFSLRFNDVAVIFSISAVFLQLKTAFFALSSQ